VKEHLFSWLSFGFERLGKKTQIIFVNTHIKIDKKDEKFIRACTDRLYEAIDTQQDSQFAR